MIKTKYQTGNSYTYAGTVFSLITYILSGSDWPTRVFSGGPSHLQYWPNGEPKKNPFEAKNMPRRNNMSWLKINLSGLTDDMSAMGKDSNKDHNEIKSECAYILYRRGKWIISLGGPIIT